MESGSHLVVYKWLVDLHFSLEHDRPWNTSVLLRPIYYIKYQLRDVLRDADHLVTTFVLRCFIPSRDGHALILSDKPLIFALKNA
jgi:hypothetical protein